jgi:hypothetical protein
VNNYVTMSTGKTAAQVARALGAWVLAKSISTRTAWADERALSIGMLSFGEHGPRDDDPADLSVITIVDSGLPEIEPDIVRIGDGCTT